jgi:hypothetical protein
MNTTALIGEWHMGETDRELDGRFHSNVDILAVLSGRDSEPSVPAPVPSAQPVLMKRAGDADWEPLTA